MFKPDYYAKKTEAWVVFPWERKETVKNVVEEYLREGRTVEEAREKLIKSGLNAMLVDRFIKEVLESSDN